MVGLFLVNCTIFSQSYVTYEPGTLLGDDLCKYCRAKVVSESFKIPLLYKPFPHSNLLVLDGVEKRYDQNLIKGLRVVTIKNERQYRIANNTNTLYVVSPRFRFTSWTGNEYLASNEVMEWHGVIDNAKYKKLFRDLIKPKNEILPINMPNHDISVAIHIRKPGTVDSQQYSEQNWRLRTLKPFSGTGPFYLVNYADMTWPLTFPPTQYYIDQLKRLITMFPRKRIYVHMFTNDKDPDSLIDYFKKKFSKENIVFGYAYQDKEDAYYNRNIINDLINMSKFDCIIRSMSHFSQISTLIGEHSIVIYPRNAKWDGKLLEIDQVGIINSKTFNNK